MTISREQGYQDMKDTNKNFINLLQTTFNYNSLSSKVSNFVNTFVETPLIQYSLGVSDYVTANAANAAKLVAASAFTSLGVAGDSYINTNKFLINAVLTPTFNIAESFIKNPSTTVTSLVENSFNAVKSFIENPIDSTKSFMDSSSNEIQALAKYSYVNAKYSFEDFWSTAENIFLKNLPSDKSLLGEDFISNKDFFIYHHYYEHNAFTKSFMDNTYDAGPIFSDILV